MGDPLVGWFIQLKKLSSASRYAGLCRSFSGKIKRHKLKRGFEAHGRLLHLSTVRQ